MRSVGRFTRAVAVLVVFAGGCSTTGPEERERDAVGYPLAVGDYWEYARTVLTSGYHGSAQADTLMGWSRAEIIDAATVQGSADVHALRETIAEGSVDNHELDKCYENHADGLYLHGVEVTGSPVSGSVTPRSSAHRCVCLDQSAMSFGECLAVLRAVGAVGHGDSIEAYDPAIRQLPLPLSVGMQWTVLEEDAPFRVDRIVRDCVVL